MAQLGDRSGGAVRSRRRRSGAASLGRVELELCSLLPEEEDGADSAGPGGQWLRGERVRLGGAVQPVGLGSGRNNSVEPEILNTDLTN